MPASAFVEVATLGLWLGATSVTPPVTVYVGLLDITNTELTGSAYARVAVTNNTTNWPTPTGSAPASVSNGTAVAFPQATSNWNTATWFAIYDASTSGHLLFQGQLLTPTAILAGNTCNFPIGALVVQAT